MATPHLQGVRVNTTAFRGVLSGPAWFGVILAAVLGLTLLACGQAEASVSEGPPPDAPGRIDAQVGDTVERDGVTITVLQVAATGAFGSNQFAADANFFITIQIKVQNTGSAALNQGAEALVLELPDGSQKTGLRIGLSPLLPTGGPAPGTTSDPGWRSWEVPEGTRAATLSYRPRPDLEIRYAIFPPAPSASLRPDDFR